MVNDALVEYFSTNVNEIESTIVQGTIQKMRLRTRIRCFAWAPPPITSDPSPIIGTQTMWGPSIVAVADEDNHIALVAINSPATTLDIEQPWSGQVLSHFSVIPEPKSVFRSPGTFDEIMQQQRHISQLTWSPWTVQGDRLSSVLIYATNADLRARVIAYNDETVDIGGDEVTYPNIELRYGSRFKWSPKKEDGDKVTLALTALSKVIVLVISTHNAAIISRTEHDLDGYWDEMSGAAWDYTPETPTIHLGSLQAKLNNTTRLQYSNDSITPVPEHPRWREQLWEAQNLFSAQHDLQGHARTKIWGLDTSPLGDFIAACSTVHPTDMVEYGPPNERRSSIVISELRKYGRNTKLEMPVQDCSAEGLVFTLRKWAEGSGDGKETPSSTIDEVTNQLFDVHWKPEVVLGIGEPTSSTPMTDLHALIKYIKHSAFLNPHTVKDRITTLVTQTLAPSLPTTLPRTLIAYRLASFTSTLPTLLRYATPFSIEIAEHHRRAVLLINAAMESSPSSSSTFPQLEPCDTCDFCSADIPLDDLDTATCRNGHEFSRCGISFLAIQKPRISKYCGLCKTPYLSEEFVGAQEEGRGNGAEAVEGGAAEENGARVVSLSKALYAACDVCIYCGGKFTG